MMLVVGVVVVVGLGILTAIPPLIIGPMVNQRVAFEEVWDDGQYGLNAEEPTLTTRGGRDLVAHEVPAEEPRAVVIFLSGIHNPSVTGFFGHADMLLERGYASLLVEMRAHDVSEGDLIALGFREVPGCGGGGTGDHRRPQVRKSAHRGLRHVDGRGQRDQRGGASGRDRRLGQPVCLFILSRRIPRQHGSARASCLAATSIRPALRDD